MDRTPTTDYIVVSIQGHSQGGGDPDSVANKIMKNWYLQADPPNVPLHTRAIPFPMHKGKIKFKTWPEGGKTRGKIVFEEDKSELRLDYGVVNEDVPMGGDSVHRIITLQCNYLLSAVIECKPIADSSLPTATTTTLVPSKSSEPLKSSTARPPESEDVELEAPLEQILAEAHKPSEAVARVEETVTQKPMETAEPAALRTTKPRDTAATNGKHMPKSKMSEKMIRSIVAAVASGLGLEVKEMLDLENRDKKFVEGRQLSAHILKDLLDVGGSSILPVLTPKNTNSGGIYGMADRGREHAEREPYKTLAANIVAKAKSENPESKLASASPASRSTPVPTKPVLEVKTVVPRDGAAVEAAICALIEMGVPTGEVASSFGLKTDEVHASVGRMIAENRDLVRKIRTAAKTV